MTVLIIAVACMIAYGAWEFMRHRRRMESIPDRIHVNGTRGKSSVTRLIAAGLRAGGIPTMAKTTGTLPRIIDMQGLEVPVIRPAGANIIEQIKVFRYFTARKPKAVVVECMAVQPEYQWICEHKFIHSTVGVITNCRLDHVMEMGPTIENITRSLCNTLPPNGIAFTSEQKMLWLMRQEADKVGCKLYTANSDDVTFQEMSRFDHIEHAENVALALAVCEHFHVPRETALEGMYQSHPDAGAMRVYVVRSEDKEIRFVNALAANDPESTLSTWNKLASRYPDRGTVFLLINTRADRYDRTIQLLEMIRKTLAREFSFVILIGEKTDRVYASLPRYNIHQAQAVKMGLASPERVYQEVFRRLENKFGTVFAIGNAGKGGLDVARYFASKKITLENAEAELHSA